MRLKHVKLINIRSYTAEQINFPKNSVLLSGDIGSGKSTILLAIEFALFGVIRGDLDGAAMLRHGKANGSVELAFELDGHNIEITRTLKRGKSSVAQTAGHIIIDGVKTDCTAVELKAKVLDLLGYPASLVSKSKSLIYRYTVYTPQEEMKHILFEDAAQRIETLRKVFQIDSYKRIRDNAASFTKFIKEKETELKAKTEDLSLKLQQRDDVIKQQKILQEEAQQLQPLITDVQAKVSQHKAQLQQLEVQIQKSNEIKTKIAAEQAAITEKQNLTTTLTSQLTDTNTQLAQLQSQTIALNTDSFATSLSHLQHSVDLLKNEVTLKPRLQQDLLKIDTNLTQIAQDLGKAVAQQQSAADLEKNVLTSDTCPVCKQQIAESHKNQVQQQVLNTKAQVQQLFNEKTSTRQSLLTQQSTTKDKIEKLSLSEQKIAQLSTHLTQFTLEANALGIDLKSPHPSSHDTQTVITTLSQIVKQARAAQSQKQLLEEKTASQLQLQQHIQANQEQLTALQQQVLASKNSLSTYATIENDNMLLKQRFDEIQQREKDLLVKKAGLDSQATGLTTNIQMLSQEITLKQQSKKQLQSISETHHWIDELFINLMETIEKQVMLRVYHEFNSLFQNWFNILMEDETISGRLDDSFTPIIEVNGYETPLEHLSGGEKTSCALAYRLALNKVINDIISTIKTKDLIILDEPTDGFSSEQLEKVRDLLEQLNLPQIIIVSHESKVESFVDNVIRIVKEQHVSHVLS